MKNCIIVNWVALHNGAAYSINMSQLLTRMDDCDVIAIVSANANDIHMWRELDNVKLIEVDGYTSKTDFLPKAVKFLLKDRKRIKDIIDSYHSVMMYIPGLTYWTLLVKLSIPKVKYIYTMHDPIVHNDKNKIIKYANTYLAKHASQLIILSNTFFQYVMNHYKKKEEEINVIPLGYEGFDLETQDIKNDDIGSEITSYNLLFFGRIDEYKGLDILAEAYENLRKTRKDIQLTIAGSGDFSIYKSAYDKLQDVTIINRWISNDEMVRLFKKKNTISILPYKTATQSGVITLAKKFKTPIIATNCGGIAEQLDNGAYGFLVEVNNPKALEQTIEAVIDNPNITQDVVERACKEIETYDNQAIYEKLSQVVYKIMPPML